MHDVELLSPAGNLDKMKYAFAYGADAVYAGVKSLSLRVKENEFSIKNIKEGIKYAHNLNKKIYVTVNIYPRHYNEKILIEHLDTLASMEPDAFIVSDPGILMLLKENFSIPLHLSVQANTTNKFAAKFWYKMGVERVILARELSLDEIKEIHDYVPQLELEFFIHGSICMTYSGRCLLSAYMSKRNPNLGVCAHSCRWSYKVYLEEIKRPGELMEIIEDEHGTYILNSKDLCMLPVLKDLIDAGVVSLKIEGRNKTEYYVATVTRAYRKALDFLKMGKEIPYDELMKELYAAPNRGFITSFLDMPSETATKELQEYSRRTSFQTHLYVCKVLEKNGEYLRCHIKNKICKGEKVEIITPNDTIPAQIEEIIKKDKKVECAHPGEEAQIKLSSLPKEIKGIEIIRKLKDNAKND